MMMEDDVIIYKDKNVQLREMIFAYTSLVLKINFFNFLIKIKRLLTKHLQTKQYWIGLLASGRIGIRPIYFMRYIKS